MKYRIYLSLLGLLLVGALVGLSICVFNGGEKAQGLQNRDIDIAVPMIDKECPQAMEELGPVGGQFLRTRNPVLSADGRHIAYFVKTARGLRVVRDGKADKELDEISSDCPKFSADGSRLVYTARKGDQWFGVVDGKVEGPYDATGTSRWSMLGCSPDGKHVWYSALTGGNLRVVVDGKPGPVLFNTPLMRMMPNGDVYYTSRLKATGKTVLVINGKVAEECDGITWLEPYPGPISIGRRAAYVMRRGGKWFPVILGKEQPACDVQGGPVYSPDGKHFAYIGTEDGKQFVVVDGKRGATFEHVMRGSIGIRDSGQAYYIAGSNGFKQKFLIVGDKRVLEFYAVRVFPNGTCVVNMDPPIIGDPVLTSYRFRIIHGGAVDEGVFKGIGGPVSTGDGKHWAYAARRGRTWYLVVDGKAQAKDVDRLAVTGFLADGRLVYHAVKNNVGTVFVGKKSAPGASRNLRLTKDSAHAIWVNKVGQEEVLMVDGTPGPKFSRVQDSEWVKVSPSGRYAAYHVKLSKHKTEDGYVLVAGDRTIASSGLYDVTFGPHDRLAYLVRGPQGKDSVFVDERLIGQYDSVQWSRGYSGAVFFSPDGRHYVFLATTGSRQMMVVNGIEGLEFERILAGDPFEFPPVIGPTSVTYFGIRKGKLYRVVHALGNGKPPEPVPQRIK